MAISSGLSSQSLSSGIFAQIQQQQAQHNADQAELRASALQAQAQNAVTVASHAQQAARSLKVEATQAEGEASNARQGLVAMKSLGETQARLGDLREQIGTALSQPVVTPVTSVTSSASVPTTPVSAPAVINAFGQTTGTLVNVVA